MNKDKPEGWLDTLNDLVRAKFNYENCNAALKKKFGDIGAISGSDYREYKVKIDGGVNVDEKLGELHEQKRVKAPKEKRTPVWDKKKQQVADSSKLAEIINAGLYQGMMPFCATQQLTSQQVQETNPGGAIVASINYYFPEVKLEHPLITLGIRVVIMYIKFKSVCGKLQKAKDPAPPQGFPQGSVKPGGLKPNLKTEMRK